MAIEATRPGVVLDLDDAAWVARALAHLVDRINRDPGVVPGARLVAVTERLTRACEIARRTTSAASHGASSALVEPEAADDAAYEWITAVEAARILGCSPANVRDRAQRGTLPARRAGGRWVLPAAAIERAAQQR
ncbi:helix-turn-helix domain-containing protein [Nocardia sp. NPDC051981]|uniref:helix-turn-helix domain-containing protein n=1 Tax=Nocardia sp. NPDC051981 TaxID=3155417 RepID=UPI003444EF59